MASPAQCSFFAISFLLASAAASSSLGDYQRSKPRPNISLKDATSTSGQPDQVHVSLAGPGKFLVSWISTDPNVQPIVDYGRKSAAAARPSGALTFSYEASAVGTTSSYTFAFYRSGYIHSVVLGESSPLLPNTVYFYVCGRRGSEFSFKTPPPTAPETAIKFAVIGDLGQTGWSVSTLQHVQQLPYDVVVYAGDLSYADLYQPLWDSWGRLVQPSASSRPWMTVEGNHEIESLLGLEPMFKSYNTRWRMPYDASGSPSNLFYSFDAGSVHFLMLGSYADYSSGSQQYSWLKEDLRKLDRKTTPWLVAVIHAPWYNSNTAHQGDGDAMKQSMEPLLYNASVDLVIAGHVHAYERTARVFGGHEDACRAHHITVGDGGNREGLASKYLSPSPSWSLKREASFGHGRLEVYNSSIAVWRWHRNNDDVAMVADEMWLRSFSSSNLCQGSLTKQQNSKF